MNFVIKEVVIDSMSTHWIRIQVLWLHEEWGREEMFYHRKRGNHKVWTDEKKKIIAEHYLSLPASQLMALLPDRTWKSVLHRGASTVEAKRGKRREETVPSRTKNYSYSDLAFMREQNIEGKVPYTNWVPLSMPHVELLGHAS